jgi:hypothetical protein
VHCYGRNGAELLCADGPVEWLGLQFRIHHPYVWKWLFVQPSRGAWKTSIALPLKPSEDGCLMAYVTFLQFLGHVGNDLPGRTQFSFLLGRFASLLNWSI